METKVALVLFCFSFVALELTSAQCINRLNDGFSFGNNGQSLNNFGQQSCQQYGNLGNQEIVFTNLEVLSGSNIVPATVTVTADNLIIDGAVAVTGNLPIYGAIVVDGSVPSNGQATVVYNAGNGVSLNGGGCGQGLAGGALSSVNLGGFGNQNGNFGGVNVLSGGCY